MPRHGLTEEKLIQEGMGLVAEKGPEHFSIRDLATRLDVRPASLYNHMGSAAELMEKIGAGVLARLEEMLEATDNAGDPRRALLQKALAYRRFALENPNLYRVILRIPREGSQKLQDQGRALYLSLYPILDNMNVPEAERVHFCRTFRSAMHGFIALEAAGFFGPHVDPEESYAYMIDLVVGRAAS